MHRKLGDIHGLAAIYNDAGYLAITQGSYEAGPRTSTKRSARGEDG